MSPATTATAAHAIAGGELTVTLETAKAEFMVSEPTRIDVVYSGTKGVQVQLSWMGRNSLGRPSNYAVELRAADGEKTGVVAVMGSSWVQMQPLGLGTPAIWAAMTPGAVGKSA